MEEKTEKALKFYRVRTEPASGRRFIAVLWFGEFAPNESHAPAQLVVAEDGTGKWGRWFLGMPLEIEAEELDSLLPEMVRDAVESGFLPPATEAVVEPGDVRDLIRMGRRGRAHTAILAILKDPELPAALERLAQGLYHNRQVRVKLIRAEGLAAQAPDATAG